VIASRPLQHNRSHNVRNCPILLLATSWIAISIKFVKVLQFNRILLVSPMAAVRDPAFWKRFSTAVHLDEAASQPSTPITSTRPSLKQSESWLESQHKEKRKNRWTLCLSVLVFVVFITIIALVLIWLSQHGWFMHGEKISFP